MGYDLKATDPGVEDFHFGAFSWPILLEAMGCLWPSLHSGGQFYCVFGADDPRFHGVAYPPEVSNDGFEVTEEEARIMARFARNFVAIQRSLPDEHMSKGIPGQKTFEKADVEELIIRAMSGKFSTEKWPAKIRVDFTDNFEKFAEWAERSKGFSIW